ncbi:DNA repair exonuclease [Halobacteriales archaeon QS_1_68_20]|nr:MAG: DNA repair exonuclease [Halobacteriales archaeon QS_1_68_20]
MTTVLHTADTHLGYRQYNSPERREDFLAAFRRVLEDAVSDDVDAVVHAGDVFHDRRPGLVDLLGTVSALRTLDEADIPFFAVVGNHEDKREAQWLDLFETMGLATRLDESGTVVGDVTLYGLDYVPPSQREDLDYEFEPPETERAALVAHGQFAPLAPSIRGPTWDVEDVIESANVEFDAVLLGDEHEADRAEVGETWVTYAGSTERTSASERDARGYNLVEFGEGVRIRRRGLETREFAFVDVELREDEGVERVRERVREYDLSDAVALVTIDGEGDPITPAEVEEYARERGAMVARVNDRRELESEDEDVEVRFADPDEAVRERVRELGLSSAARGVDRTVRTDAIADSNVRDEVKRDVEELLSEDPAAFDRVPEDEAEDGTGETGVVDAKADAEGVADGEAADDDTTAVDDAPATDGESATGDASAGSHEADETAAADDSGDGSDAAADAPAEETASQDDQASMEEFL